MVFEYGILTSFLHVVILDLIGLPLCLASAFLGPHVEALGRLIFVVPLTRVTTVHKNISMGGGLLLRTS